jgi:ketosteroid isomerase-like protein
MQRVAASFVLLLCVAGCQRRSGDEPAVLAQQAVEVRRIIEAHNADAVRWYAAGHIDSVARLFAPDARQMGPNAVPLVGREAIRKYWTEAATRGTWTFTLSTQDVTANGPLAIERGTYTLAFTPGPNAPDGMAAFTDRGNYLVQWRRENGTWLIVNDIATSELPMRAPAK